MSKMALSMKPTGWFQVGWSGDIGSGDVVPMRFFGRDLVAYRTDDGEFVVLDAYCEHLGANMAHGGTVHGDDIQCPFHGWRWSPQGKNTCIPYQDAINRARRVPSWHTAERDGVLYLWHDVERGAPAYDAPGMFDLFAASGSSGDYHPAHPAGIFRSEPLPVHPQYVIENGVDFAHFKYVHRADEIPEVVRREFGEHEFRSELALRFRRQLDDGRVEMVTGGVEACVVGVGIAYSYAWGIGRICSLTAVTPVDDENAVVWYSAWASKEADDETMLARRQRSAIGQLRADLRIWEHQRYTEPPGLATAEAAGFRDVRRWARRFYPPGEKGHEVTDQLAATDAPSGAVR